jgi:hypothetical protein
VSHGAGLRIVVLALVGWSVFTLHRVALAGAFAGGLARGLGRQRPLAFAAAALAVLTLLAAEALWNRRLHAFPLYALWAVAAMGTFVLLRLASGSAHLVRFMPSILVLGLVFAAGAILLRRAA